MTTDRPENGLTRWERDGYRMVKSTDETYGFYEAANVDALLAAKDKRIAELEAEVREVYETFDQFSRDHREHSRLIAALRPLSEIGRLAVEWAQTDEVNAAHTAECNLYEACDAHLAAQRETAEEAGP